MHYVFFIRRKNLFSEITVWHSEFKLYLYPEDPQFKINQQNVILLLHKLEFTGSKLSSIRYSTGNNFVSLLTFLGCSPNIELESQDDKPYCYIEIETSQKTQFVSGENTKFPSCPHCKKPLKNTLCSRCDKKIDPTKLNWRKSAFVASSWITIGNIYELEAVPNDQLLSALKNETGVCWKPAYIRKKAN